MERLVRVGEKSRFERRTNIFYVEQDEQHFGVGTVEETVGGVRQPLTGYRPRAEDFVFAKRFDGGGGDGSDSNGVTNGIEDLDGIAFRAVGRDVMVH